MMLLAALPSAWGQHKAWRQYTTDDGLPSNEVFDVVQDHSGYLWFVTSRGICRFNGYEFMLPVDTSNMVGSETFVPAIDARGRIWFARLDKSIWIIENDSVKAWPYNYVVKKHEDIFSVFDNLSIDKENNVWLSLRGAGFLVIDADGRDTLIKGSENYNLSFKGIDNHTDAVIQSPSIQQHLKTIDILHLDQNQSLLIGQFKKDNAQYGSACLLQNGEMLISYGNQYAYVSQDQPVEIFTNEVQASNIYETPQGQILLTSISLTDPGFYIFPNLAHFLKGKSENALPGYKTCNFLADREGGWWVTSQNGGVFYCKNPDLEIYDEASGFSNSQVLRLTKDNHHNVYVGLRSNEVLKINTLEDNWKSLHSGDPNGGEISALYFDTLRNTLWKSPLEFLINGKWDDGLNDPVGLPVKLSIKKFSPAPSGHHLWMSAAYGFYKLELPGFKFDYFKEANNNGASKRTFSILEDKEGTLWVATVDGLRIWENGQFQIPPFDHPGLHYQARDLELLPDGSLLISLLGGGIIIRSQDGQVIQLTEEDGLSSDYIPKLCNTQQGDFYACSDKGLNRVFLDKGKWKIKTINNLQGLPSNFVNDVIDLDGELWIGTEKGLVHLKQMPNPVLVPAPLIEKLLVNNKDTSLEADLRLKPNQNNITIHYFSLHFRSEGDIVYRYRLNPVEKDFNVTKSRSTNFPNLAAGTYSFEVQAKGEGGAWSESTLKEFDIKLPWWKTFWFLSLVIITISSSAYSYYHARLKNFKKASAQAAKMKDLELAALRAQMNPHFIFNCLGSVQQYITQNKPEEANRYLSRFAKLIRLSLHSSVDGKHSLSDEIHMLDHYLALEQMRFKGRFNYTITADPVLDHDAINIPPMLVQPFVENAVLHGVKQRDSGGLIEVTFSVHENTLEVSVRDNGEGIQNQSNGEGKEHKSLGMSLTNKRLALLSGSETGITQSANNLIDSEGNIIGLEVLIHIQLL
jgi:ligand-binding sensor domain-containing protein